MDADHLKRDFGISDPDNLRECRKVFQEIFGVDGESLRQVALKMGKPDTHFKTSMESQEMQRCQQDGWTWDGFCRSGTQLLSTGLNRIQCRIYSHHRRYMQQKDVLKETAGKAMSVLSEILTDSLSYRKV